MERKGAALLVFPQEELFERLEHTLHNLGVETQHAHDCTEARRALCGTEDSPSVIFTHTHLADGTWADVLSLAKVNQRAIPVIMVSRVVDIQLYLEALEGGVCDFIVPPFSSSDLTHVLKTAVMNGTDSAPFAHRSAAV